MPRSPLAEGRSLLRAAQDIQPDIIITGVTMPPLIGIEAVRQIRKNDRTVRVIFLTIYPDVTFATEASVPALRIFINQPNKLGVFRVVPSGTTGLSFLYPADSGGKCKSPANREITY